MMALEAQGGSLMTPHILLSVLMASPPTSAPVETVRTYDLGKMTFEEAKRLDRQAVRVTFVVGGRFFSTTTGMLITAKNAGGLPVVVNFPIGQIPEGLRVGGRVTLEGQM